MKILLLILFPLSVYSQNENIEKMKRMTKVEFEKAYKDSIVNLESLDLYNFILSSKESEINLNKFNSNFISRLENAKWPIEMHFLIKILIDQNTEKAIIENILNNKRNIWDKGEWSDKFWKIILENNYLVSKSSNYSINENGKKKYNFRILLDEKTQRNEIGLNPLLSINYSLVSYTENELLQTLLKLDIKDIQVIPKDKSIKLYGKRGIDGMIDVLTN